MSKPHKHEIWKPVLGFEGLYEVSNLGRVKSLARTKQNHSKMQVVPEKILVISMTNYPSLSLWKDGKLTVKKVHRIVAESWICNPHSKPEVNHIDANRTNNKVENLEWVTRAENVKHATDNFLPVRGAAHPSAVLTDSQVEQIRTMSGKQKDIASMFCISQSNVSTIKNYVSWRGYGNKA